VQILQCLSVQGGASGGGSAMGADGSASGISRAMVKDRFKTFNAQFEELHQRQSQWTVPDSELRESLRLAVAEVLLPAYRSFQKRFGYGFHPWDLLPPLLLASPCFSLSSHFKRIHPFFLLLTAQRYTVLHVTGLWLRMEKTLRSILGTLLKSLIA
jgi:hypothetical protein